MQNTQRYVNIGLAVLAAAVGFFFERIADTLWGVFRLRIPQDLPFTPAQAIGVVIGVAVFVILKRNVKVTQFCNEVVVELSKVTYPQKKETLLSSVVVTIMVAICSIILFAYDTVWGTVIGRIYK